LTNRDISVQNYQRFSECLEQETGIALGASKQYLVLSRLVSFLHEYDDVSVNDIIEMALSGRDPTLKQRVMDAMTTNETLWFRDGYPFKLLDQAILPNIVEKQLALNRPLRIWSAACSSGQEAYSIAMTLLDYKEKNPRALAGGFEIIATDISSDVLEVGTQGKYDKMSIGRGLPSAKQSKYFTTHVDGSVTALPKLRHCVKFKKLNLLSNYITLGSFDIVFCRNVLIYFSPQNKQKILQQIAATLVPNGSLLLGASESVASVSDLFTMQKTSYGLYYTKRR
jgi:chemotaxis protein methyltransferase CheR